MDQATDVLDPGHQHTAVPILIPTHPLLYERRRFDEDHSHLVYRPLREVPASRLPASADKTSQLFSLLATVQNCDLKTTFPYDLGLIDTFGFGLRDHSLL